ncbi:MAG: hypothetical protein HGA75_19280 [Thiobacillus sp.]|nr:hypothetical protein [Thiobacillus sp.]
MDVDLDHARVGRDGQGLQARVVGTGFANACRKSGLTLWACSILPEHVHAVIARHRFKVEYIVGLLKGEATKQLKREQVHPLAAHTDGATVLGPWAERCWRVFLDSEAAIDSAIHYVNENPVKEGKPLQTWSCVAPFAGIATSGWTTYH